MFKANVENHTVKKITPISVQKYVEGVVDALSKKALAELFFGSAKAFCDAWVYQQSEAAVTYHGGLSLLFSLCPFNHIDHLIQ